MAMSTDMGEQNDFGRMARGSAGVSEPVCIMEQQPWSSLESFEAFAKRKAGVCFEWQPWSVAKFAKEHAAQMQGYRALQKNIMILGQTYKITLQKNDAVAKEAFVGAALKC